MIIKRNGVRNQELSSVLFVLFVCTYFIYGDLGLSATIPGFICIIIVFISCYFHLSNERTVVINSIKVSFLWIAIVMFTIYCRFDSVHNRTNLFYIGIIFFCALMLFIMNPNKKSAETVLSTILAFSVAIAIYIIFFSMFKDLYRTIIYPILGEKQKQYYDLTSLNGYGVSLGGVTFSSYMIVAGLAVVYGEVLCQKYKNKSFFFRQLLLSGILLIALLLLGRKGEMISFIFAFVVTRMIEVFAKKGIIKRRSFIIAAILLATFAFGTVLLLPTLLNAGFLDRYVLMLTQLREGKDITSGRVQLWKWGWELFKQNQVFGGGLGSFANFIPKYSRVTGVGTAISSPHIVYLHFLCEFGIVGFVMLMIPFSCIFATTVHDNIQLSREQTVDELTKTSKDVFRINTISLFIQLFFAVLFFFDQVFSLTHFWLFYSVAIYLSSTASFYCNRNRRNHVTDCPYL